MSGFLLCGSLASSGGSLYSISYTDTTSGYFHAYRVEDRFGRAELKLTRSAKHPADSRCPGCADLEGDK